MWFCHATPSYHNDEPSFLSGDDPSFLSGDEQSILVMSDSELPEEFASMEESSEESDNSCTIDLKEDALDDETIEALISSGAFDGIPGKLEAQCRETKPLKFTGITNAFQTCYLNSTLQAIAMCLRKLDAESFLPTSDLDQGLFWCLAELQSGESTMIAINRFARRLISRINRQFQKRGSRQRFSFGAQLDPTDVLPTICEMMDSWCGMDLPLFHSRRGSYSRSCNCHGVSEWTEHVGEPSPLFQLTHLAQGGCAEPLRLSELLRLELTRTDTCANCGMLEEQQILLQSPSRLLIMNILRLVQVTGGDFACFHADFCRRRVRLESQIMMPVGSLDDLSFAIYNLCAVICHEGLDGAGHYVTYTFSEQGVVRISDVDIRVAAPGDLQCLEERSVLLFFEYDSTVDEREFTEYYDQVMLIESLYPELNGKFLPETRNPVRRTGAVSSSESDDELDTEGRNGLTILQGLASSRKTSTNRTMR